MKKIYGFLGAVALVMMASCSKDATGVDPTPEVKGDLFMTMNIVQSSPTRTTTPDQGYEEGKDRENNISSLLVIFAHKTDQPVTKTNPEYTVWKTAKVASGTIAGTSPNYIASFTLDRQALLDDIGGTSKTYYLFAVANPSTAIEAACKPNADVQQVFSLIEEGTPWVPWTDDSFLMSSADVVEQTINANDIAIGTHTTQADAYHLNKIQIQRAMSRFDLETNAEHLTFKGGGSSDLKEGVTELAQTDLKVSFDAVALINMTKKANLFKVMAQGYAAREADPENEIPQVLAANALGDKTIMFHDERQSAFADWWVMSPDQENTYLQPLFSGLDGDKQEGFTGTVNRLASFFEGGADFQYVKDIAEAEADNAFTHPTTTPAGMSEGNYHIWRYCMENTNPDLAKYQKNGNSTGIVLRAQLSGAGIPDEYAQEDTDKEGEAIYAYNNVVLGTAAALKTYATSPKGSGEDAGVYESVTIIYDGAVEAAKKAWKEANKDNEELKDTEWDGVDHGELSDLDEYLVEAKFSIYRPTPVEVKVGDSGDQTKEVPVYYCYYIYWNRHNDNTLNTQMGTMEFATVRNNVYKIMINKVISLGHPGEPEDDPEDPKPDDPDEKDKFWLDIKCEILKWEVRMNGLDL